MNKFYSKILISFFVLASTLIVNTTAQTFTFTNAGATGRSGPTQAQINSAYTSTTLAGQVTSLNGIQIWTVPVSGVYRITASGARGGNATSGPAPGSGATMAGDFILFAGEQIRILVGQEGQDRTTSAGGGGGTFVTRFPHNTHSSILIIAGGGGASSADYAGLHGTTDSCGTFDADSGPAQCNGNGGISFAGNSGSGGGGFFTDGAGGGIGDGGKSYVSGGLGGTTNAQQEGGFGGGGGQNGTGTYAASGGGGYSGGNGGNRNSTVGTGRMGGGGGGSKNNGTNQLNIAGNNYGHGQVVLNLISSLSAINDAGVISIDAPTVFCPDTHHVVATIRNYGTNQIDSVLVNWSVNNVTQMPLHYKSLLDTIGGIGQNSAQVTVGSYPFLTNQPYNIVVWTSMPNGVADTSNINDTISKTVQSSLPPPINLSTLNVSSTSATFTWNGGSVNTWLYTILPFSVSPSGVGTLSTSNTVVVSNLNHSTTYDFYVREVCAGGDTSLWAGPLTFTTPFYCPPGAYCFTNCGQIGNTGPSQTQCNTEYAGSNLAGNVSVIGGIQEWVVPVTGNYKVEAYGAQGSNASTITGGLGAFVSGEFFLQQGETLRVLVGQNAPNTPARVNLSSSGGGGTFVTKTPHNTNASILVIAGGGGGTGLERPLTSNGTTSTTGQTGSHGTGGTNGNGGTAGINSAGAGAGFFTDGVGGGGAGFAYVNGGAGGPVNATYSINGGGFGGGGSVTAGGNSRYGGGGGYSGGSGSSSQASATTGLWGGGGGSYNNGTNQVNIAGVKTDHGAAIIIPLGYTIDSISHTDVICFGDSTGTATVHLSGNTTSVTYIWSNGDTTATASGLVAGTHSVTISDLVKSDTVSVTLATINTLINIDSVLISNQTNCAINDGAIQAFVSGGTSPYTYSIDGGTNYLSNNGNFTALSSGNFFINVKDSLGCEIQSATVFTITSPAGPSQPNISGDTSFCQNNISVLTAVLNSTHGPNAQVTWYSDPLLQSIDSVGAGSSFTPAATVGTQTYYAVVFDSSCVSAAASHTITINALPIAPSISSAATYCQNESASALSTSANGLITWYSDSALTNAIGSGNSYTPSTLVAGSFVYYATQTDTLTTCESTSGNVQVIVNALPTVSLSTLPTVCEDAILQPLTGGVPSGGTYSGPGVNSSLGIFDPSIGTGVYTISYSFIDANGCTASDSTNLTVALLPTVSFSALAKVCEKSGLSNLSGGLPIGGVYSGQFVNNNQFYSDSASTGSYTITYTYTDSNGCANFTNQTLQVDSAPLVSMPWLGDVCQEVPSITLSGGLPAGGSYAGVGVSAGVFIPANGLLGNNPIEYSITDNNGCTGRDTNFIFVNPTPSVSLGNDTTICGRKQIVIDPLTIFASYNWNTGATTKTVLFDSVATVAFSKTFTITVTDANGCMASASMTINWSECVGINENMNGVSVNYFPNPTQGTIYLDAKGLQGEDAYISITNLQGQVIYNERLGVLTENIQKEINLNREAKGVYFVRLFSDNYNLVHRIVIN